LAQVSAELSKNAGKTISPAQTLIRWSLEQGFIPLPKTVTAGRIASNLDVFDWEFTDEARKTLDKDSHEISGWDPTVYQDPK
ncbi:hypothetical protein BABINDRAFT_9313, partial [Babjeviella inositovora NRRL Y-12698]